MTELLIRFHDCPVLVVGDLMLDEFIWGNVSRISPEAPVPVVQVKKQTWTAGGAANTAANVRTLGGRVSLAGVLGDDAGGRRTRDILEEQGVNTDAVIADTTRPTTTKTRVVAHSQQVVRIDHEQPGSVAAEVEDRLYAAIATQLKSVCACVVSDYGKGVVTTGLVRRLIAAANDLGIPVVIDPKGTDYAKYRGATLVKPNQLEAGQVLNRTLYTGDDVDQAGAELLQLLGPKSSVLVTRGPAGMSLFEHSRSPVHIPAQAREVYDVTGAGDTVAGTLALCMGVGATLDEACRLASLAAAVVVAKVGTATCSVDELRAAVQIARW
ncbi:MAG: D-glycero-beta-D-manno-heptose-7-phosphate kinase [Fimbriiglobus sp.]|nr:D-glycero-beta-D-manno-heptose-7-phosphate kinase [Fimbriiglobus sp.]